MVMLINHNDEVTLRDRDAFLGHGQSVLECFRLVSYSDFSGPFVLVIVALSKLGSERVILLL